MIGPEIPPHLLQNNTALDNDPNSSICPKTLEYPTKRFEETGPQIPAALPLQDKQEQNDEAGDDFGPVLPPDMLLKRFNSSVLKPAFPYVPSQASSSAHASGASGLPHPIGQYEEDSDDGSDDFGPKPLLLDIQPMHEKDAVAEFMEKEERRRQNEEKAKEPKALKREEWMLVPPSASDLFRSRSSSGCFLDLYRPDYHRHRYDETQSTSICANQWLCEQGQQQSLDRNPRRETTTHSR